MEINNIEKLIKLLLKVKDPLAVSMITVVIATLLEKLTKISLGFENGVLEKTKAITLLTTANLAYNELLHQS